MRLDFVNLNSWIAIAENAVNKRIIERPYANHLKFCKTAVFVVCQRDNHVSFLSFLLLLSCSERPPRILHDTVSAYLPVVFLFHSIASSVLSYTFVISQPELCSLFISSELYVYSIHSLHSFVNTVSKSLRIKHNAAVINHALDMLYAQNKSLDCIYTAVYANKTAPRPCRRAILR